MDSTADESVNITSSGVGFDGFFEKMASNVSGFEGGGTVVETEIGLWREKKDATWTSASEK